MHVDAIDHLVLTVASIEQACASSKSLTVPLPFRRDADALRRPCRSASHARTIAALRR